MSSKKKTKQVELPETSGYIGQGIYVQERNCLTHLSRDYIIKGVIESGLLGEHSFKELAHTVLIMPKLLPEMEDDGTVYIVSIRDGDVNGVCEIHPSFLKNIAESLINLVNDKTLGVSKIEEV